MSTVDTCVDDQEPMSIDVPVAQAENTRSAAIGELLDALQELSATYLDLPESERIARCTAEADRITAEVARHLFGARTRLSSSYSRR